MDGPDIGNHHSYILSFERWRLGDSAERSDAML